LQEDHGTNISEHDLEAARRGETIKVTVNGTDLVIVRADIYDRTKQAFNYDEIAPADAYPAILEAWDSVGSPEDAELYKDLLSLT